MMININILNKLETKLIFFLKYLKIFRNSYDNLYYIKLQNTNFTYYVDSMINTRENKRINLFDSDHWTLICETSLDKNELIEYLGNKDLFNVELLKIVIDKNKFFIPEFSMDFKIIEFKNGIYNLINNIFIDYSKIHYIYNDFIGLDIKSSMYCNRNYDNTAEFPIYFIDDIKIFDLPDNKKIYGLHFFSALCIYIGFTIKKNGIIKSAELIESGSFLEIIKLYSMDADINIIEIYNKIITIFFLLENLYITNTTDRNYIVNSMINFDMVIFQDEKEFNNFLQITYLNCLEQIKKLDNKTLLEEENFFFNYIVELKNSMHKNNPFLYWYTNFYIDNVVILLLYSFKRLNKYVFLESHIKNNKYLIGLGKEVHDNLLLSFSNDETNSLNDSEKNYNHLNMLIDEKKTISFFFDPLNKLLFL